jgi:hypothetical protein
VEVKVIEKSPESSGNVLGFKVAGKVTKADYEVLVPAVEGAVRDSGDVRLLLDLTAMKTEAAEAWGADLKFGHEFHKKITRMAIVGDKKWEAWLTKLAQPFYAVEAEFFPSDQAESAWAWLRA